MLKDSNHKFSKRGVAVYIYDKKKTLFERLFLCLELYHRFFDYGSQTPKKSITTSSAAETIKLIVPKKNDSLASPLIVFAPATEKTIPTKDKGKLAI